MICEELEMNSAGSIELVPAYVFAVGHNDDFIIAKQHPTIDYKHEIDTSITNYYIVDMNRKIFTNGQKVFGPVNKYEFDSLRTLLNIESIKFDLRYPKNP